VALKHQVAGCQKRVLVGGKECGNDEQTGGTEILVPAAGGECVLYRRM
jgi:hypothetical protein